MQEYYFFLLLLFWWGVECDSRKMCVCVCVCRGLGAHGGEGCITVVSQIFLRSFRIERRIQILWWLTIGSPAGEVFGPPLRPLLRKFVNYCWVSSCLHHVAFHVFGNLMLGLFCGSDINPLFWDIHHLGNTNHVAFENSILYVLRLFFLNMV